MKQQARKGGQQCFVNCEMLDTGEVLLSPRAAAAALVIVIKIAAIKQANTP